MLIPSQVTRAAVAGADLQVGLLGVPERLVRDVPADRHRGEPAPAAVGREARRTIGTDRGIDHVTVLVGEAQTGEIGFDGIFRQSGAGIDDVGGHARHVERRRGIVLRINVRRAAPGLEERVTHHGPEFEIFADLAVIVGVEVDRVGHHEPVPVQDAALVGGIGVVLIVIDVVVGVGRVVVVRRPDRQALDDLRLGPERTDEAVVVRIGGLLGENLHGIVQQQFVGSARVIAAVGFVGTVEGTLLHGASDDRRSEIGSRDTVVVQVVAADVGAHLQPFEHFVVDVRLEVDLRDVVRLDDALLVVVAARKVVFGLGVAARKRQVEVVRLPEPGDQVEPVGVGHVSVGIADGLDISRAVDREAVLAVVVVDALVEDLDVLLRTDVFAAPGVGKLRDAEAVVDLDLRFALAALLGGDQHDAVGGARAVDRGRSGVLQHLDRLDVREVERRQRTHVLAERIERRRVVRQRNAVDHVKRLVAGAERRRTADAHLLGRAEVTRTGRDRHAGDAALKEFRGRHHAAHVLLGGLELADGVGHQAAALRAVTDHDHLVESHVVVFEPDLIEPCRIVHRNLPGLQAEVGDDQADIRARPDPYGERAVEVGGGADRRAVDDHRGAGDRIPGAVFHDALHDGIGRSAGRGVPLRGGGHDGDHLALDAAHDVLSGEHLPDDRADLLVFDIEGDLLVHIGILRLDDERVAVILFAGVRSPP